MLIETNARTLLAMENLLEKRQATGKFIQEMCESSEGEHSFCLSHVLCIGSFLLSICSCGTYDICTPTNELKPHSFGPDYEQR